MVSRSGVQMEEGQYYSNTTGLLAHTPDLSVYQCRMHCDPAVYGENACAHRDRKTHRNAHDFDGAFIRRSMGSEGKGEEPEQCLPFYYF